MWLTIFLLSPPLGIVAGYGLAFYMSQLFHWEVAYYAQAALMAPCVLSFILLPDKYINVEKAIDFKNEAIKKFEKKKRKERKANKSPDANSEEEGQMAAPARGERTHSAAVGKT